MRLSIFWLPFLFLFYYKCITNQFSYLLLNKKECDIVDPVLNLGYDIPFLYFVCPSLRAAYIGGGSSGTLAWSYMFNFSLKKLTLIRNPDFLKKKPEFWITSRLLIVWISIYYFNVTLNLSKVVLSFPWLIGLFVFCLFFPFLWLLSISDWQLACSKRKASCSKL